MEKRPRDDVEFLNWLPFIPHIFRLGTGKSEHLHITARKPLGDPVVSGEPNVTIMTVLIPDLELQVNGALTDAQLSTVLGVGPFASALEVGMVYVQRELGDAVERRTIFPAALL